MSNQGLSTEFFRVRPDQALWIGRDALQNRTPLCPHDQSPMTVEVSIYGALGETSRVRAECEHCGALVDAPVAFLRPQARPWDSADLAAFVHVAAQTEPGSPFCPNDTAEVAVSAVPLPGGGRRYLFRCFVCLNAATAMVGAQEPQIVGARQ